ncbi:MAG: hypothetical protein ACR5K2_03210 [Wolbachia sp.]
MIERELLDNKETDRIDDDVYEAVVKQKVSTYMNSKYGFLY